MPEFNLTSEPWLPCTMADGQPATLGLADVLARAHEIREIADPSPLVTAALHRLLLAILHRNFGPPDVAAWQALWEARRFDADRLNAYFDQWKDRFYLFDEEHPFYQAPALRTALEARPKLRSPVSRLLHERAVGNNATLFDHTVDDDPPALTPAEAARALVAAQAFALGGLVPADVPAGKESARAGPLVEGAVVLLRGDNLFETLMLNLHRYDPDEDVPMPCRDDRVLWEADAEPEAAERLPRGYLDVLTWPSRRVLLLPERDAAGRLFVRHVVFTRGDQLPKDESRKNWETMMAFTRPSKEAQKQVGWRAVSFEKDRALWRDSLALMAGAQEFSVAPLTLSWLRELREEEAVDRRRAIIPMDLLGICSDRAKPILWRHERLPLPTAALDDGDVVHFIRYALHMAEEAGRQLRASGFLLAKLLISPKADDGGRSPRTEDIRPVFESLGIDRPYWTALDAPFRAFLEATAAEKAEGTLDATDPSRSPALRSWVAAVERAARAAWDHATGGLGASGRVLEALAKAERSFVRGLRTLFEAYRNQREPAAVGAAENMEGGDE